MTTLYAVHLLVAQAQAPVSPAAHLRLRLSHRTRNAYRAIRDSGDPDDYPESLWVRWEKVQSKPGWRQ